MISVLTFYSDDPSSNPAGYLNFLHKKLKIMENVKAWKLFQQIYINLATVFYLKLQITCEECQRYAVRY